jgi:glycosyltransferase involved in cell wall biosynthesis
MSNPPRNLLLFCFAVDANHPTLNFALGWYRRLLERYDGIDIIAFDVGTHDLPAAIRVHQLKQPGDGRLGRVWRFWRMAARICRERRPRVVFSHMNTALVLAFWPLARSLRLRQVLWYAHAEVTPLLRGAVACADRVVTSTPEGCRIATGKLRCIGQGVDDAIFTPDGGTASRTDAVTTGRIAGSKNLDLLISGFIRANHPTARLHVIGSPARSQDRILEKELHRRWADEPRVMFHGFRSPAEIAAIYRNCALFINLSDTGSLDKANLEAAIAGLPVMTSNRAFAALVRERSLPQDLLLDHAHADFAPVLRQVLDAPMSFITRHAPIGAAIRADHAIGALIAKLSRELASCESAEVAP